LEPVGGPPNDNIISNEILAKRGKYARVNPKSDLILIRTSLSHQTPTSWGQSRLPLTTRGRALCFAGKKSTMRASFLNIRGFGMSTCLSSTDTYDISESAQTSAGKWLWIGCPVRGEVHGVSRWRLAHILERVMIRRAAYVRAEAATHKAGHGVPCPYEKSQRTCATTLGAASSAPTNAHRQAASSARKTVRGRRGSAGSGA
jgi:hypothetical protein